MTGLTVRPLVAGEETLFDSMPDPLPSLPRISYADGVAGGGYRPSTTWIALRGGVVVGRAAWLRPPGAVGRPWLEHFDLAAAPEDGVTLLHAAYEALGGPTAYYASMPAGWRDQPLVRAAVAAPMAAARLAGLTERGERLRFRRVTGAASAPPPAPRVTVREPVGAAEIDELVGSIVAPDLLTGAEVARLVAGVDLARQPLAWLGGGHQVWRVALDRRGTAVGLAGPAGDACYPMIAYLGVRDDDARLPLIAESVRALVDGGALEVVADADAGRAAVIRDLGAAGFAAVRSRVLFEPAPLE